MWRVMRLRLVVWLQNFIHALGVVESIEKLIMMYIL